MSSGDEKDREQSSPNLDELDSAWDSTDDDDLDEDATTVQKIPKELVALSRRGTEIEQPAKKTEEPEKHEAITARPPPPGEPSVMVDAPHERLAKAQERASLVDEEENEAEEAAAEEEADAGVAEAEEKRAAAADAAAGLDAEAARRASEARAEERKERSRAKTLAAREKRKAHVESQRMKAKKPRKRSTPPPREPSEKRARDSQPPTSRQRVTGRPGPMASDANASAAWVAQNRDVLRMVFFVAIVVVIGAFVIGMARR